MRKLARFVPPSLLARARELEALRQALEFCVDHSLYRHCAPLYLDDGILHVGCDSATWAGRLRLLARSLAPRLSSATGLTIHKVVVLVRPETARVVASRPKKPSPTVDPAVANGLESAAKTIEDPDLRAALRRLARDITSRGSKGD